MYMDENGSMTVTLTLDDDKELECEVITTLEAGGRKYIALFPLEGPDIEAGQVYLYRLIEHGDAEPDLENITEDSEFSLASEAFNDWAQEQEFADVDLDELD